MSNLNSQIANMNVEELRMAVEQQNNGLLRDMYNALVDHSEKINELESKLKDSYEIHERMLKTVDKLVAKIQVLNNFIKQKGE